MNTRKADRTFIVAAALAFGTSVAVTVAWCSSMAAMPGMEMPGGWTMSMAWMRMPGQSWPSAAGSFLGMWTVMMIAMMMPVLLPTLVRSRAPSITAAGYFVAWAAFGIPVYATGAVLAQIAMHVPSVAHATPIMLAG